METTIKTALDKIVEGMDTFRPFYELQSKVAKAMKKNPSVVFKGANTLSDYTSRMAKHLVKPACSQVLAELKATYREVFSN
jgi:hypothetical protein